ncbi:MAG: multidrug ABC transporter permease [Acidobacteria bacterium]|nr:MAG: multidrug ABC transporter permease [Acidobacteriota bacterium]
MATIPLNYSYRNLLARKLTTLLTVLGISLVVFVFAAILMLASGLRKTLIATGSIENFVVIRKGAESDTLSEVDRDGARLIATFPEVETGSDGKPLVSPEMATIVNQYKYGTNSMGNIIVRGVSPNILQLRPQIKLVEGKFFRTGTQEIIVGRSIESRFQGCRIGQTLKFATHEWTIVGVFEAEKSSFESEIFADVDQLMGAFDRSIYSTVTCRLKSASMYSAFKTRLQSEPRLQNYDVKNEQVYYGEQSEALAKFIKVLGLVITIIFSFGAMIGAMITMYASVANRTIEIGTLRSLGFLRRNILIAFLIEALCIAFVGGAVGLVLASFLQTVTISTLNFTTFSELAFGFTLTPDIITSSFAFSFIMGIVGGFLPAVRASRLNIVAALRSA